MRTTNEKIIAQNKQRIREYETVISMRKNGRRLSDIAQALSMTIKQVNNMLMTSRIETHNKRIKRYKEIAKRVVPFVSQGYSMETISKSVGICKNTIAVALGTLDIGLTQIKPQKEGARHQNPDSEFIIKRARIGTTAWVKCECGRSSRRSTDLHCVLCDHEYNRGLAGLNPNVRFEPSLKSFENTIGI
jgi:hypothetical protein